MTECCNFVTVSPNLGSGRGAITHVLPRGPSNSTELNENQLGAGYTSDLVLRFHVRFAVNRRCDLLYLRFGV
jgi:hypothetical protein